MVDAAACDLWVPGPEVAQAPTGSLPVRDGVAGTRVAATGLGRPGRWLLLASGYQKHEVQPLPQLTDGIADTVVPMPRAFVPCALHSVAGLPTVCARRLSGADRAAGEFSPGGNSQFAVNAGQVKLHGASAKENRAADLGVCPPLGNEQGDLQFLRRQPLAA